MINKFLDFKLVQGFVKVWRNFKEKHPEIAQFIVFYILCNGVTVLQMILMPIFKALFNITSLVDINFQVGQIGNNFDGSIYYMFNYATGFLKEGGGGGLAYFLAIQMTLAIAQVINFFGQRNITFRSKGNIWNHVKWYLIAYILISLAGAALQGLYKTPVYNLFMNTWEMGGSGETIADLVSMIITSAISFWIYYPILKIIFKDEK